MYVYNTREKPPCPCVEVSVMSLFGKEVSGVRAKLDTGASRTCVPMNILELLKIHRHPSRRIPVKDYNDRLSYRYTYYLHILSPEFEYRNIEVTGIDAGALMLIGRDLINRWRLFLDGPRQTFEIKR